MAAPPDLHTLLAQLRAELPTIVANWMERVRENQLARTARQLEEPLLRNHVPQLLEAILQWVEDGQREEIEQYAAVHGFTRRVSRYDVVETVLELMMLRRALWEQLAQHVPWTGPVALMARVDGLLDRASLVSLQAFLDPNAQVLERAGSDRDRRAEA